MQSILKISLEDIKSNWKSLNNASGGKAAAVVKANAYGMGVNKIAEALIDAGCYYFYVANINEGVKLRKKNNSKKISIAIFEGYFAGYEKIYSDYNLIPIINSIEQLIRLNNYALVGRKPKAILNVDTGMNRLGLNQQEISYLLKNKEILNNVNWDYIMSHLANAQEIENKKNLIQLNKIEQFSKNFPNIKISFANTGGIKLGSRFCFDQTRPGIGLFGIDNYGKHIDLLSKKLKLPIKLYVPIIQIKNINAGESVSYGGIDILKRSSILATVGIGYADGWLRLLKPNGVFLVGKQRCKIVGNITMDSFILDITDIKKKKLKEGDYICILDDSNIENMLRNMNIMSYELLALMGERLQRSY